MDTKVLRVYMISISVEHHFMILYLYIILC